MVDAACSRYIWSEPRYCVSIPCFLFFSCITRVRMTCVGEKNALQRRLVSLLEPFQALSRSPAPVTTDLRFLPVDLHFRFAEPGSLPQSPHLAYLSYTQKIREKTPISPPCPTFFSPFRSISISVSSVHRPLSSPFAASRNKCPLSPRSVLFCFTKQPQKSRTPESAETSIKLNLN